MSEGHAAATSFGHCSGKAAWALAYGELGHAKDLENRAPAKPSRSCCVPLEVDGGPEVALAVLETWQCAFKQGATRKVLATLSKDDLRRQAGHGAKLEKSQPMTEKAES